MGLHHRVAGPYRHVTSERTSFPPLLVSVPPVAPLLCVNNPGSSGGGRGRSQYSARLPCRKHALPGRCAQEPPSGRGARVRSAGGDKRGDALWSSSRKGFLISRVTGFLGKSRDWSLTEMHIIGNEARGSDQTPTEPHTFKPLVPQGVVFCPGPTSFKCIIVLFQNKAALWH